MYLNNQPHHENQSEQSAPQPEQSPPDETSAPIRMLTAYSQHRADTNTVMRSLISHRNWFTPLSLFASSGEQVRRVESGLILSPEMQITPGELWVFTDREAAFRAQAAGAPLGTYAGGMNGTELFRRGQSENSHKIQLSSAHINISYKNQGHAHYDESEKRQSNDDNNGEENQHARLKTEEAKKLKRFKDLFKAGSAGDLPALLSGCRICQIAQSCSATELTGN